nr:Gag-Pol polyprotein [Tanacetum cinerariifolium]
MYVCQPEGFIDADHPSRVYKLNKALYELKQAPTAWYDKLSNFLLQNHFFNGTIEPKLFIRRFNDDILVVQDSGLELTGFLDVDYAGCRDTFKSTSGGTQFLGEKLVGWSLKKQDCTALLTTKAEYVSLIASCAQVIWMRTQLTDYCFHFNKILIYCDSKSGITISCNLVQHSISKHIAVHYHFIKKYVEKAMYDDYIGGQPSSATRTASAAQAPQILKTQTASTTTQQENQDPLQLKIVVDNVLNAMLDGNTFLNPFAPPSTCFIDVGHPSHVYKLKKALYVLKQAPKAWYDKLLKFLLHNHFFKGTIDPTLFIRCFTDNILVAKPTEKHLKEVKRILCYLRRTINIGLWYTKDFGFELTGFSDADYAMLRYLQEYFRWNSILRRKAGGLVLEKARLYDAVNRKSKICVCIAISCNPVQHSRTKHVTVRYHFIKENMEKGTIKLYFVKTDYQLVDLFSIALPADMFNYLVLRLEDLALRAGNPIKECMTRSSTTELFTPFKDPKPEFRSSRKHFKTLSLDESRSPNFDIFSDQEEYSEKEIAETMAETMEQYISKTRADYGSGVVGPKIEDKDNFELKGQFLKELRTNTFSDPDQDDANKHIQKVLEIVDLFHIPNITKDQIMLRSFPMSLTGAASRWLRNKPSGLIKNWEDLMTKYLKLQEVVLFYNGLDVPTRQILDSREAIPSKTTADVKSISNTVEADASSIRGIGSHQYVVSTRQNSTLMYETRQTIILFPSHLNDCYCKVKKGSYEPKFLEAYSNGASHFDKSIPRKEKNPRSFSLPCYINNVRFDNALADLGASDIKVPLIIERPFLSIAHAKIDVFKRKITLRVREEKIIFKSVKRASSLIKRVYMLSLRERMEFDLEVRLMGDTSVLNRSLDPLFRDYIELNDLNVPLELRRDQVDDLMPTIEEGGVVEEFRARNDARMVSKIFGYPSDYDHVKKIRIDCAHNLKFSYMIVLKDMDAYRDEGMGDVIFGKPFLTEVGINARWFEGMIAIYNGNDEVTYQMVRSHPRFKCHTNEQCNKIPPLLRKPITCCVCEGPLRGEFCFSCDSKAENSFTYDPNAYSFNDTSSNFNHLPQPQYETYLCELCGNDSHYGYDYQPQFPFVYEQEPSYNQNYNEMPKILLQAWEKFFAIQHAQPEDTSESFQKLLEDLHIINKELAEYINSLSWNRPIFFNDNEEHSVQYKEYLENSSNEIVALNFNQEKEGPPQDSDIRQLIREECCIEVCKKQKHNIEDTLLELIKVCRQKEFYCMHNNVDVLIESDLNSKLLSINLKSQRLDKKKQEVKNVVEQLAERGTRIVESLQNFRVIHKKSSISLNNTSQISPVHAITPV